MKKLFILSIICLGIMLSGCETVTKAIEKEMQRTHAEQQANNCNTDAAYASGINDAKNGRDMQTNYARVCDTDKSSANSAYQAGYTAGLQAAPPTPHHKKKDDGWGCIKQSFKTVCGYGCMKGSFDKVKCFAKPHNTCVKNNFSEIKCGRHCSVGQFNKIQCEIERYSPQSDK